MSKNINATIKERLAAVGLLNAGKFNNSTLAVVLDDIKTISMTEEEWVAANLTKTPNDEEMRAIIAADPKATVDQVWNWQEVNKDIELQAGTVDALLGIIKEKSDGNELTVSDAALLSLQAKLEAE